MKHTPKEYAEAAWRIPWIVIGVPALAIYCFCVLMTNGRRAAKRAWRENI